MPRVSHRVHGTLVLCLTAVVSCSSASHLAPKSGGSITVTVDAADNTAPSVVIAGPNSYAKTITATQTLSGLAPGTYTIVADSATGPDLIIGTNVDTGTVTGSPATVADASTATVTVSYAMKHHVGGLWIANNNSTKIPEMASSQLRATGAPTPAESVVDPSLSSGLALDANGDMWVSTFTGDTLTMYTPAARNAGGTIAPSRRLVSSALSDAENLEFDAHGNLWVANCDGHNILAFSASQLTAGGTQTPTIAIGGSLFCPSSLAFADGGHHIVKYSAAQLATTGSPTPADTIGAHSGSLNGTTALAFGADGRLWVASEVTRTIVGYTPAQLAAGGAPTPYTVISLPGSSPFGLAFDQRGTLWVSDGDHGIMDGLTSAQIAATGSPTPAFAITVTLGAEFGPEQPLFDPYVTAVGTVSSALVGHPVASLTAVHRTNPAQLRHIGG